MTKKAFDDFISLLLSHSSEIALKITMNNGNSIIAKYISHDKDRVEISNGDEPNILKKEEIKKVLYSDIKIVANVSLGQLIFVINKLMKEKGKQ